MTSPLRNILNEDEDVLDRHEETTFTQLSEAFKIQDWINPDDKQLAAKLKTLEKKNDQLVQELQKIESAFVKNDGKKSLPRKETQAPTQFLHATAGHELRKDEGKKNTLTGKVEQKFLKGYQYAEDYKGLFSLVPSYPPYTTTIASLAAILTKTIVTWEATTRSFRDGLLDINDHVLQICVRDLKMMIPTSTLILLRIEMCLAVFHFYIDALKWFQTRPWTKLIKSLGKPDEAVRKAKKNIEDIAGRIREECTVYSHEVLIEIKQTNLDFHKKYDMMYRMFMSQHQSAHDLARKQFENYETWHKQQESEIKKLFDDPLRLGDTGPDCVYAIPSYNQVELKQFVVLDSTPGKGEGSHRLHTVNDLKSKVHFLEPHLQKNLLSELTQPALFHHLGDDVRRLLWDWHNKDKTQLVWMFGTSEGDTMTRLSACVLEHARQAGLPAVAYFVQGTAWTRRASDIVRDIIYSIIYQLVHLLSFDFTSPSDLSHDRFQLLDGSESSLEAAVDLVEDLLAIGPRRHVFLFDGFQHLNIEDSEAARHLGRLLRLLKRQIKTILDPSHYHVSKILLTTSGQSYLLGKWVKGENMVDVTGFSAEKIISR